MQLIGTQTKIMGASYIDDLEFEEILSQPGVLVVDYTATWCGPCRVIAPSIDKLAEEYGDRAKVVKIDLDKNKANARKYSIRSIPAVLFFKDGELKDNLVGKKSYENFAEALENCL